MATLNGAKALGIDHLTGSLEVGKAADMIAVHLDDVTCQPHYHVESQLVYAPPSSQVTDSWIGGKQVMKNRQLTTLDLDDILSKAKIPFIFLPISFQKISIIYNCWEYNTSFKRREIFLKYFSFN